MTEQPLWRRQQAALAAEQAAPDPEPVPEQDFWQAVGGEYIRPDGSFVHVRDTRPAYTIGHGIASPASGGWGVAGIKEWTPAEPDAPLEVRASTVNRDPEPPFDERLRPGFPVRYGTFHLSPAIPNQVKITLAFDGVWADIPALLRQLADQWEQENPTPLA